VSRIAKILAGVGVAGLAVVAFVLLRGPGHSASAELLDQYCIGCHNGIDFAGSMRLDDKDASNVGPHAETWEHVVRKLRTGMMPPAGEPRPPRETLESLAADLESRLDESAAQDPYHAPSALRRLNRTEYANAIRDLLDLNVDASTLLPLDDSSDGFDNMAVALGVSPSLVESYVSSAMKISRWALGDRTAPRTQAAYSVPEGLAQNRHIDGLPLGTRGGMQFEHLFPLDAEYDFRIRRGFGRGGRVDVTIDGRPVETPDNGPLRIFVPAGPHVIALALVETRRSEGVEDIYSAPPSTAGIRGVEIDGPLQAQGVGDTPSRRKVLICTPESSAGETACATEILMTLASRAFRRPAEEIDVDELLAFFDAGRNNGDFESGIQQALARILVDPRFIYRIERDAEDMPASTAHPVDDYELATRLSFFLWSTIPDDELLAVAASGRLSDPDVLEQQVRRMLIDDRSSALTENFAAQWLFLRELDSVTPDAAAFDENLREAMASETKMLFETIVREDLSIVRLLDADFTFVDARLAEHYGYDGIRGSHFRRIDVPMTSPRQGLLGHASILTVTSVTNRTSPVIRGSWILENLIGSPAPVPPPDVETTLEGDDGGATALTVRARLEAHRENPVCASCHAIMDPVGLTLENFDLIGAWRDQDNGQPIDARSTLVDGTAVDGIADLRRVLLDRTDAFVATATEKLLSYALGRRIEYYDMPTIRAIVRQAKPEDYRFSSLIMGVIASEAFRTRVRGEG
jgi:hypothetical protein